MTSNKIEKTNKNRWVVYLVRCSDNSLYCGVTNDLEKRINAHVSGKGAKYTRSRRPIELVGASPKMTKSDAFKLEYRVKHVSANKKISKLLKGEPPMTKILKKDLMAVSKEIKALEKKVDKLIAMAGKLEKTKVTKKPKAKSVKKSPAKKKAVAVKTKATRAKKRAAKK